MINFIKQAVESVEGIKSFLFNTDYRNNFDLQNVEFPCCVLTPVMRTKYNTNNLIYESAELQLSIIELAPYDYDGDILFAINKRCSELALQVIANLRVKSKIDKDLTFEFILPSGDELVSGIMCTLQVTSKQPRCAGKATIYEVRVEPIKTQTITKNGKYIIKPSEQYDAIKGVELDVAVAPNLQNKSAKITQNGQYEYQADAEFEGIDKMSVEVEVKPTLENVSVEYAENGEYQIAPQNAEGIGKVDVKVDVAKELDFDGVFDQEQANEINQYYKDGIAYARAIKDTLLEPMSFFGDEKLTILPYISSLESVNDADRLFARCYNLALMPSVLDFKSAQRLYYTFSYDYNISNEHIIINAPKCISIEGVFSFCRDIKKVTINAPELKKLRLWNSDDLIHFLDLGNVEKCEFESCIFFTEEIRITNWKYGNITLYGGSQYSASPLSVHHTIQNAVGLADGATARTLILSTTIKTNWQNSEYYEQDLAVLSTKGITIA